MSLADFHRPASERLAVQHVEGKGDVVPAVCLKLVRKGTHTRQTVDAELAPEQLKTFKYLVTENTRLHHLESMAPLKLAVHNNLARALAVSSCHRHQVGNSASKPKSSQHMRRTRPILLPLDTDAARAYTSTNPGSDSPPDSPGPATPADEAAGTARAPKGFRIAQDKAAVSPKPLKKGVMYRVHSKGSKARLSRRF
ncbi:hypothetical protein FRC10_007315 [Ceratobasidium sp. 414]|nr:hypothetical protein FRC10_007315 [Ceratobasidium sp. 414]